MGRSMPTIGHATSVFLTGDGGQLIQAIPGIPDAADHGMQEVRGSNPLSSTPTQTAGHQGFFALARFPGWSR